MDKLAERFVDVMHKYQALGRDIESLRDHLANHDGRGHIGVRVLACILTASELEQVLVLTQITALSEWGKG